MLLIDWQQRLAKPQPTPMRVVFLATAEIALPLLRACLNDSRLQVQAVVSQPDRPAGRGQKLTPPVIAVAAREFGLTLFQPERLRDIDQPLAALKPDLLVTMAYGKILPEWLLLLPRIGPLNLHASLLPRHRGAAPIQAAILAGDEATGITLMGMEPIMDAGPILLQKSIKIAVDETAASLHNRLALLAAQVFTEGIDQIVAGGMQPNLQDEAKVTFAKKLTAETGHIDWRASAVQIDRLVRALSPQPAAYSYIGGERYKIHRGQILAQAASAEPGTILQANASGIDVATGLGIYRILNLQAPSRRALNVGDFLAGSRLPVGAMFL